MIGINPYYFSKVSILFKITVNNTIFLNALKLIFSIVEPE